MYKVPDLPVPKIIHELPKGAIELWLRALERPEADLKIKAAEAFARAYRRGHKEAAEATRALVAELDRTEEHRVVRLALADALITLEARSAAPSLFKQLATGGGDLRHLIEPALARWDYAPARELWLARLDDQRALENHLLLAMRGLAAVRETKAADRLRTLMLADRLSGTLRLEAAAALAALKNEGLEPDAEKLAAAPGPRGLPLRLMAATLLRRHQSPRAIEILHRLGGDAEPAVAARAVGRLIEIDPSLVTPAVEKLLASADAKLRSLAVTVLFKRPSDKHLEWLAERLDDVHPDVREQARRALIDLGKTKEWHEQAIAQATRKLADERWRALEQAIIILTELDHKVAAGRFLELLDIRQYTRPEVYITAGWGLRHLDVAETLPAVAKYVEKTYGQLMAAKAAHAQLGMIDFQLSQLCQFLGHRKFATADAGLRIFVPKRGDRMMPEARAAAVWALGLIHEGKNVAGLAGELEQRLNDATSIPPEDLRVRQMAALTLGRMRAKEALPSLQKAAGEMHWKSDSFGNSCVWAVSQITGEAVPPPKTVRLAPRDWFLLPDG